METWEWHYLDSHNGWVQVPYEELIRLIESGVLTRVTSIGWSGLDLPGITVDQIDSEFFYHFTDKIYTARSESELHLAFSENRIGPLTRIWGKSLPPNGILYEQLFFHELDISPDVQTFINARSMGCTTVLSGPNNSGKSLILKLLKKELGYRCTLLASNRFYHFDRLGTTSAQKDQPLSQRHNQFVIQLIQNRQNSETSDYPLVEIISQMSDAQRQRLFELVSSLLGETVQIEKADPSNELSYRYVTVGGENIALASTGTRLLVAILAACLDTTYSHVIVDEPEIGLSPKLQLALAKLLYNRQTRESYFPHIRHLFIATHSHLFLDRSSFANNFLVTKDGRHVSIQQVDHVGDYHDLQLRMLGNDLASLFLPSAIILVEGATDQMYIRKICTLMFPEQPISVVSAQGEGKTKDRLHVIRQSLGELSSSPYRYRLFVLLDKQHSVKASDFTKHGLPDTHVIILDKNGIEYFYPHTILCRIFHCDEDRLGEMQITDSHVSLNGYEKSKMQLCDEVVSLMTEREMIPEKLRHTLLDPLQQVLDYSHTSIET